MFDMPQMEGRAPVGYQILLWERLKGNPGHTQGNSEKEEGRKGY